MGFDPNPQSVKQFAKAIDAAIYSIDEMEKIQLQSRDFGWEAKGKTFAELLMPKMEEARQRVDYLETIVDNSLWPLPKYREMLFLL